MEMVQLSHMEMVQPGHMETGLVIADKNQYQLWPFIFIDCIGYWPCD